MVFAWDHGWVCRGFLKRAGVAPKQKVEAEWYVLVVGTEFKEESRVLVEVFGRRWLYYDWTGFGASTNPRRPGDLERGFASGAGRQSSAPDREIQPGTEFKGDVLVLT